MICNQTRRLMSKIDSEPEPTEIYINTDGMRKLAKSVKEGQGTRVGSMAKMLIDCCDKNDRLEAENKELKRSIQGALSIKALWEPAESMENVDEGKAILKMAEHFERALKVEDKDNG